MAPFLQDWRQQWQGKAIAVVQPETADAVSTLVRWCGENRVAAVPQGGNTGLAGGSVPDESGRSLVISLARLNQVRAIDAGNNTMIAEAGCTLQAVRDAADSAGRLFPLSLPSQGSCTIGGNLSTNAGGTAVLRYGNARELCLGLEVVCADGRIWNGLRGLRKDNTGLDLRDLFVGAEGTLGIITAAVLKLFPRPAGMAAAFACVASPDAALSLLASAQAMLGPSLTTFEIIGRPAIGLVLRHFPATADPFAIPSAWYVLMEASDWRTQEGARDALFACLKSALGDGTIADAVLAQSAAQAEALWQLRHFISDAQAREGASVKHDVSVPISAIPRFIEAVTPAVEQDIAGAQMIIFGHAGDGNLHCNVQLGRGRDQQAANRANRIVHDLVMQHGGSISAEHGLGVLRAQEAARFKSAVELDMLSAIRQTLDPLGIMNPGKGISASLRHHTESLPCS